VPFTLAHAAAALPSRRLHLIPSAVVVGTFAPDFEYFLRLAPDRGFGHTAKGILELSFPLAILVLWIFHTFVKVPVVGLLPDAIQRRLTTHLDKFSFRSVKRLTLIGISVLLGIGTHVLWDSFTHPYYWPYRHWSLLRETVDVPVLGAIPYFKVLQHGSTVTGIGILLFWLIRWYQTTKPSSNPVSLSSRARRIPVVLVVVSVAFVGGIARAVTGAGVTQHFPSAKFVAEVIVTTIALAWWQLVVYGMLVTFGVLSSRNSSPAHE
jgi:hypothetical protein